MKKTIEVSIDDVRNAFGRSKNSPLADEVITNLFSSNDDLIDLYYDPLNNIHIKMFACSYAPPQYEYIGTFREVKITEKK